MLTVVEVKNRQGLLLNLPLEDESSGLIIEKIEGLDPVEATLVSTSFAGLDGAQYQSARREPRNIKIKLEIVPDYITESVRDVRKRLYQFFMPKSKVDLRFRMSTGIGDGGIFDDLVVDIVGRVETCTSPMFEEEPFINISLMCFDPDFLDPELVVVEANSTSGQEEILVDYAGTVETGLLFTFLPTDVTGEITIYHRPPDGLLHSMEYRDTLLANDILKIGTSVGDKHVTRTRAGVDSPFLHVLSPYSPWLELQPGENYFRAYSEGVPIPYTISYTNKYGGL